MGTNKMTNAFEYRAALKVAASAAMQWGASDRQIDMLVAISRATNDYSDISGGRLTRMEATRIINDALQAGVVPDYNETDEELDAADAQAAQVEARIAEKKIAKAQKEAAKEFRDAQKLDAARSTADGRKIRHIKYGLGDVIAEDDISVTAIFAGQKKPTKLAKSFVEFV
jgi:hypothetical protein